MHSLKSHHKNTLQKNCVLNFQYDNENLLPNIEKTEE